MPGKRILLIGPLPPPVGGDTVSTSGLLSSRYWEESGFEIEALNTSGGGGVKTEPLRRNPGDLARGMRILTHLAVRLHRTDIVLLWANSSFICSIGSAVIDMIRLAGKPVIVKIFGAMLAERLRGLGGTRRKVVLSALSRASLILPQTAALKEELDAIPALDPGRIVEFPNFLPDGFIPERLRKGEFGGRCVFIGQIKKEKGIFDIIESLRGRNDLICDFYGPLYEGDRDRFMGDLSENQNCRYRGLVSRDEIMGILCGYDVLLLPTTHPGEGYPAVVLEAFAAGVPVIASRWKSIPELVEDGKRGLLVPPSSPAHITAAIDVLAGDAGLYESLAANAYEYVGRFSEKEVVGGILIGLVRDLTG
jgi:glycosyltransferase involved in cell wall biosynthesis